ncbi:hypothetical protein AB0J83_30200 [Actinoplanes sp. NPDC049596]|uniref:hypothetical protein n=1 Tax=unclassified Actinoplanes TaxID=2626549 RepID=UPI0034208BCE
MAPVGVEVAVPGPDLAVARRAFADLTEHLAAAGAGGWPPAITESVLDSLVRRLR